MIVKNNHEGKLYSIKINTSKEAWIEAFEKRVEKYEEGKDISFHYSDTNTYLAVCFGEM